MCAGVKGIIRSQSGVPIAGAEVTVDDRIHPVRSTARGEYWRVLLPGTYTLKVVFIQSYRICIIAF